MSGVSTYLNFTGETEETLNFYKSVFGTEFAGEISRTGEAPPQEGRPELGPEDKALVMQVALPILG